MVKKQEEKGGRRKRYWDGPMNGDKTRGSVG